MTKLGCFLQWLVNVWWLHFVSHIGVEEFFIFVGCIFFTFSVFVKDGDDYAIL